MNKNIKKTYRYILTGTPGSGKTSVLKVLEAMGYLSIHEAATDVILDEQNQGKQEPWKFFEFIDHIILIQKQRQIEAFGKLQFYDRSPICTYALACYLGFTLSPILMK
jgi:predicted ATPase